MQKIILKSIEEEKMYLPLWELNNGIYRLFVKEEIDPFRNAERAVKTTQGFISINDLFRYADQELRNLFYKDGNFVLNSEVELEVQMRNRSVVGIRKV